jgi:hypothetical protein
MQKKRWLDKNEQILAHAAAIWFCFGFLSVTSREDRMMGSRLFWRDGSGIQYEQSCCRVLGVLTVGIFLGELSV